MQLAVSVKQIKRSVGTQSIPKCPSTHDVRSIPLSVCNKISEANTTPGVENLAQAIQLKIQLASVANDGQLSGRQDFSGVNVMAEWPVVMAYAKHMGPI